MEFELSAQDKKLLKSTVDNNKVGAYLKAKQNMNFNVGDVLVKHILRYDYTTKESHFQVETINSGNKMPQRYVVIHQDEHGIYYIKQLKVSTGSLGKDLWALTEFDFTQIKFEIDSEYAVNKLLDGDFNIKELHKKSLEQRKIISKMNKKIGKRFKTLDEINKFFDGLNVGDTFYTSTDFTAKWSEAHKITKITKSALKTVENDYNWSFKRYKEKNPNEVMPSHLYKIHYTSSRYTNESYVFELKHNIFYTEPPAKEDKT